MDSPRQAWLFVRGAESIRMTRLPMGVTLLVCGPGTTEHSHHFDSEPALEDFRRWYEERLAAEGWALHAFEDRRASAVPPPGVVDRRRRGRRP